MNENMIVNIVGGALVLFSIIEILMGKATDRGRMIKRSERPILYWLSVLSKLIVGLMILNIKYLRAKYGA